MAVWWYGGMVVECWRGGMVAWWQKLSNTLNLENAGVVCIVHTYVDVYMYSYHPFGTLVVRDFCIIWKSEHDLMDTGRWA